MAVLYPSLPPAIPVTGLQRELDVLRVLERSLSEGYEIFYSVPWHTVHEGRDRHGEIDLVVLGPTGNILLLEIKSGAVELTDGVMYKMYKEGSKDVGRQLRVQHGAMVSRLQQAGLRAAVTNCLVLPDFRVEDQHVVGIPPERIVDATRFEQLGSYVMEALAGAGGVGGGGGGGSGGSSHDPSALPAVRQFLRNQFKVTHDLRVLGAQLRGTTLRLADGLATWVPRIDTPSGVLRIQATAGSGKTQLALRLLQDAAAASQRSLYVCYNRALADHITQLAPTRAQVASFHELCVEHHRRHVGEPDFGAQGLYDQLSAEYKEAVEATPEMQGRYQLIIIDEGQDFEPEWVVSLLPQLAPEGRIYLLEDAAQRLYPRDEFDLSDVVTVHCQDNFRTPRQVCQVLNALQLSDSPIEARSAYEGEVPNFHIYTTEAQLRRQTEAAVKHLLSLGIALPEIALVSWRGLMNSVLIQTPVLGDWSLRRPTGKYSSAGDALWTEGELLVDSVYRFKGQSAAGIVLTEVDFATLDEAVKRKLFVGLTRAHIAVEVVLTERAAGELVGVL
ncbi:nuclease-related domain-containing DEAD/DEAH box helicase [Zwartia vadi]|uniref:nuclease-related domain-containing DEAD/DEAH box helicase n=1 Tax=Zwartia vadi TaxID=3058168 RepID=UPI0025B33D31|nr:NERD domain-containing protein/DEAD/DEAH box helicase [Zwartia vadi]MDN3987945.1 NERD domain-containing protein/DEAD/DEAH box helicase [Zwartia vadi]